MIPEDANHASSARWMERYTAAGGLLVAPAILLVEVAAAISRQTRDPGLGRQATGLISNLDRMRLVPIDQSLIIEGAGAAADLFLRAADALYVAVAARMDIPLVSWDSQQLQRASIAVATLVPDAFLD